MSSKGYFLDTSAIAKLYLDEVGSHRMKELYDNKENNLAYSELAYTESISAFRKIKNRGTLTEEELDEIIESFQTDFYKNPAENMFPISLSDVVFKAPDIMKEAHKLKDKVNPSLQYLQSLDSLQLTSWLYLVEQGLDFTFVTSDTRLASIATTYKDSKGWDLQIINLAVCACEGCDSLREAERAAS